MQAPLADAGPLSTSPGYGKLAGDESNRRARAPQPSVFGLHYRYGLKDDRAFGLSRDRRITMDQQHIPPHRAR